MPERIERGTHKDVMIFPDLYAIAAYYPDIKDEMDFFGSSSFFFEYKAAINDILDDLDKFENNSSYKITGADSVNEIKGAFSRYAPTHKWALVFHAWKQRLKLTKQKPPLTLYPSEYFELIFDGHYVGSPYRSGIDITLYSFISTMTREGLRFWEKKTLQERANIISPLNYFPPLEGTGFLDEPLFYDPSDPDEDDRITSLYGSGAGEFLLRVLKSGNKRVRYSEIIKPVGYGFEIDFAPLGIRGYKYSISFGRDGFFTKSLLQKYSSDKWRIKSKDSTANDGRRYDRVDIYPDDWVPPYEMGEILRRRDSWIQAWYKRGEIPLEKKGMSYKTSKYEIDVLGNYKKIQDLYPIKIESVRDVLGFDDIFTMVLIVGGVAVSAYTGRYGAMASMAIGVIGNVIKKNFPSMAVYVDIAIPMVVAPMLSELEEGNEGKSGEKRKKDTKDFLISISSMQMKAMLPGQENDFRVETDLLVENMDKNITPDQKRILSGIAWKLDENITSAVVESAGRDITEEQWQGLVDAMESKKATKDMMIAGGIVGLALLIKHFKK